LQAVEPARRGELQGLTPHAAGGLLNVAPEAVAIEASRAQPGWLSARGTCSC
jgi:hypothetical protein